MIFWGWLRNPSEVPGVTSFWEQHGTFWTRGKVAHCAFSDATTKSLRIYFFFYYLFVFALICDWLIATRESDFIANPWHSYAFSILNFIGSPQVLLQSSIIFWLFFGHRAPRTETSAFAMHIIIAVGIIKYVHSGKEPSLLCFKKINF